MKFKRIVEELSDNKRNAMALYKKLAKVNEGTVLDEASIDKWALHEASAKYNLADYDLKDCLMNESYSILKEETINDVVNKIEQESEEVNRHSIEYVLDRSLTVAKRIQKKENRDSADYPDILLIGAAGVGKSSIVRSWAKSRGLNLVYINLSVAGIEKVGGMVAPDPNNPGNVTSQGVSSLVNELEKPNSVLFLDEYNRASTKVRSTMLTLVQDHLIPNKGVDNYFLKNMLFTIAAVNPATMAYGANELNMAEKTRFRTVKLTADRLISLKYLTKFYEDDIKDAIREKDEDWALESKNKLEIIKKILSDKRFEFTSATDEEKNSEDQDFKITTPRTFSKLIYNSEGTKDAILDEWNDYCDYNQLPIIEDILGDYVDIQDKANSVFDDEATSKESSEEQEQGFKRDNSVFKRLLDENPGISKYLK